MEADQNRDWGFAVNLSGVAAPKGGGTELPEGYYVGKITDMYTKSDKPGRVIIKLTVTEGEFAGVVRTDGLNMPTTAEDKVRHFWRGLAESCGYTPAQLDSGELRLGIGAFKDKTVYFKYTPKGETQEFDRVLYLAPAEWNTQRQTFTTKAAGGSTAVANAQRVAAMPPAALGTGPATLGGGPAPLGAAPTNGPAPLGAAPANGAVTDKNSVLAALGIPNLA